jgi:1-deoxy-D-xylulose-5-phosphate reductoisomerase
VLPIDSEHNAVFQCLPADGGREGVRRIVLTASGGPFRSMALARMAEVTPEQAVAHPKWSMGRKISVDSATMMNKGLELIEAHFLFDMPPDRLDVVIHPQSLVHSMVEYVDGSILAQLGNPDMRTPIAHALAWPQRIDSGVSLLDLAAHGRLDFERPDPIRFPCLRLAREALAVGAAAPCVLNAANEVAVDAFLERRIRFTDIALINEAVLDALGASPAPLDTAEVLALDARARTYAGVRLAEYAA